MRTRLALILAALAPVADAAEEQHACVAEAFTTVCRSGERELRIIQDTTSPSRQYAVAWEVPDDAAPIKDPADGSKHLDGGAPDNFLVRLADGKTVSKLGGTHFGDRARYNHYEATAVWSPDSRLVAILNQSRWETDVAQIYRLSDAGAVSKPLDLLPICRNVGRKREPKLRRRSGEDYAHSVEVHSVRNDGTVSAKCSMQVVKQDDYFAFAIRLKVDARREALVASLLGARACRDESGPCAPREPHE